MIEKTISTCHPIKSRNWPSGSAARVALGFDVEGVDGLAGSHEQPVPFAAAEAEVWRSVPAAEFV